MASTVYNSTDEFSITKEFTVKTIDSGISANHASSWTVGEAIREILQNWLDVKNEFGCNGTVSHKEGFAIVKDGGPGLKIEHLAFGNSEKSESSIGQFGEGLKSAFIVLLREGRTVELRSNGQFITPVLKKSKNFGVVTLHYEISPMEARHAARLQGTVVEVECSREELSQGRKYFVQLRRTTKSYKSKFQWVEKDYISLPAGNIYVKGSLIGTLEGALFSYHLDGIDAAQAINRDRDAVNMDVIGPRIRVLIQDTSSTLVMETVLRDMFTNHSGSWESKQELRSTRTQRKVWKRVWNKLYGDRYVVSTGPNTDVQAEYRGYKVISNLNWEQKYFLMSFGVKESSDLTPAPKKIRLVKRTRNDLSTVQNMNLRWAKRMVKRYYANPGKVVVVDNPEIVVGYVGTDGVCQGAYSPNKDITYLNSSILNDRTETLHTLLHETVHRTTGTKDLTHEFEVALLMVAVEMIKEKE